MPDRETMLDRATRLHDECTEILAEAQVHGIQLFRSDFGVVEGKLTLDGMPAKQWLDAMTRN
jgi:hypothetical protein